MRTRRLLLLLLLLLLVSAAALLAQYLSSTPLTGYDDADIFFVYARNIAHGHGAVYNVGGERVEGFTSPAWVAICSAVMLLTPHPELLLLAVNIVAVAFAAWVLAIYLEDVCVRFCQMGSTAAQWSALALTAAVILAPGYSVWSTISLMDSGLWCATLLLCAICVLRTCRPGADAERARRAFLPLIVLLALVRPEAMLWGPILLGLAVGADWFSGRTPAAAVKRYAAHVASFAAAAGALTAFRIVYFGYPLPNTYYAKASGRLADRVAEGIPYFVDFIVANPIVIVSVVAAIAALAVAIRAQHARADWADGRALIASQACLLALLLVAALVPIVEGGDHFGLSRMYQPGLPFAALQAVHSAALLVAIYGDRARHRLPIFHALMSMIALAGWTLWPVLPGIGYASRYAPSGEWSTPRLEMSIAADMREIGAAFNRIFPNEPPSVGVIVAGGFAFAYRGDTIDLMGLNNVAMGHSPGPRLGFKDHAAFDPDVFYRLSPDVVLLALWAPQRPDWFGFPMLSGVFDAPPDTIAGYGPRLATSLAAFDGGILKGILRQPRFAAEYVWASVRPQTGGPWAHALFRRSVLTRLGTRGYEIRAPGASR